MLRKQIVSLVLRFSIGLLYHSPWPASALTARLGVRGRHVAASTAGRWRQVQQHWQERSGSSTTTARPRWTLPRHERRCCLPKTRVSLQAGVGERGNRRERDGRPYPRAGFVASVSSGVSEFSRAPGSSVYSGAKRIVASSALGANEDKDGRGQPQLQGENLVVAETAASPSASDLENAGPEGGAIDFVPLLVGNASQVSLVDGSPGERVTNTTTPDVGCTSKLSEGGRGTGLPGTAASQAQTGKASALDEDDSFGERGWYTPEGSADEGVGSVFSWGGEGHNHGRRSSGHRRATSVDEESRRSQPEQDETTDDQWSERRRLVERWEGYDEVWSSMRAEARAAAEKEPLLVSFIYSTILNQKTLEDAVSFHLANKLAGPNMLSTQVQALVRECFAEVGTPFRRQLRRDIIAVRERDPACESYHDCLLYFKGFQALQTHRVAHWLYNTGRHALAFYLQSQVNQEFQIDIHPAARFGEGVFIDHGTGIVIGETTVIGNDVSMLHRVTLGGSGVKNEDRHPKIGNCVLIGAGACLLGNLSVGTGTQIGAGSLVVTDIPERCVAVGVPAKVIGQGKKRKPALAMEQDFEKEVWSGLDI